MTRAELLRHALSQALRATFMLGLLADRWRGRRGAVPLYSFKGDGRLVPKQ